VNHSFEGEPQDAFIPVGWHKCSPHTTPDIFPGVWGVYKEAVDGDTFVGLITRSDGSFESIGQRLPKKLELGKCYRLTIYVAHSETYAGFNDAIRFRLWAGKEKCRRKQLLFESKVIKHTSWKQYTIEFAPDSKLNYLIIEAAFPSGRDDTRGNILFDEIGEIRPCDQV
jgi:hypothetical protein